MKMVLLQPAYFPWMGYFAMMKSCDLFVIYDDAQFVKQSWQSRNRIKTANGIQWLTASVDQNYKLGNAIRDIRVSQSIEWQKHNQNQISSAYQKTPYFRHHGETLLSLLDKRHDFLMDYSTDIIRNISELLEIRTPIRMSSEMNIQNCQGQDKVIALCKAFGANEYLDTEAGKGLYDYDTFRKEGIEIEYFDYKHPAYSQLHGEFVSHLSAIDFIFNGIQQARESLDEHHLKSAPTLGIKP